MNKNLNNIEGFTIACEKNANNKKIMKTIYDRFDLKKEFKEEFIYEFIKHNFITRGIREDESHYYIDFGTSFFLFERANCFYLVEVLTNILENLGLVNFNIYYLLLNDECYLTNDNNNDFIKKYLIGDYREEFICTEACDTLEEAIVEAYKLDSTLVKASDKYVLYTGELYNIYVTHYIDKDSEFYKESMAYFLSKVNTSL